MIYSLNRLIRKVRRRRELGALFLVLTLAISIIGSTLSFFFFERVIPDAPGIWDSLWYSVISITTIGYGDFSSTTVGATNWNDGLHRGHRFGCVHHVSGAAGGLGRGTPRQREVRHGQIGCERPFDNRQLPRRVPGAAGHWRVSDGRPTPRPGYRDSGRRDRAPAVRLWPTCRSYAARRWRKRRTAVPESITPSKPSFSAPATTTHAPTASSRRWRSSSRT